MSLPRRIDQFRKFSLWGKANTLEVCLRDILLA